ncbi:MAG: hypothetical protein KF819_14630 [Labilithrix sp.]|nr:hypothetical protein [Labilithrix sp.]
MAFRVGKQEVVRCIVDVPLEGEHGEALCVAYKTTTFWVGAGAYLRDDGYVARPRAESTKYYPLTADQIALYQSEETLPTPLPAYRLPTADYVWGYSLWWLLAVSVAWALIGRAIRERRRAKCAASAEGPVDVGPPELRTDLDRWVADQVAPRLGARERILHQAYATDRDMSSAGVLGAIAAKAYYAVLTDQRLFLLHARVGAFGPLRECIAVDEIPRGEVAAVSVEDDVVAVLLASGEERSLHVKTTKALSNQMRFLHHAPRILSGEGAPVQRASQPLMRASR